VPKVPERLVLPVPLRRVAVGRAAIGVPHPVEEPVRVPLLVVPKVVAELRAGQRTPVTQLKELLLIPTTASQI